ncbi:monoglyceride lipase [[Candida] railenensis]|uniref:Monoglyceride lipase n=1 Tax=[Candida] railenensis TaxID=45579 RepID=A0A9P0W0H6_9ASCO|nr:monoglyceride lipase [[Candida] railenensis]
MSSNFPTSPMTTSTSPSFVSATTHKTTQSHVHSKKFTKDIPITSHPPYVPVGRPVNYKLDYKDISFNVIEWPHSGKYRGKIIYLHAFGEHAGVYTEFHDKLSLSGYEVFYYEQRGSADTSWGNKDYGKTDAIRQIDDLNFIVKYNMDRRFIDEKFYLMGSAMGGAICIDYAIKGKYKDSIKCIIAACPTTILHPEAALSPVLAFLTPMISTCAPNYKVLTNRIPPERLTSSVRWQEYLRTYERHTHIGTTKFFHDLFQRGSMLLTKNYMKKFPSNLSIMILHGEDDVVNFIEGSKKAYSLINTKAGKEFVTVPGARHALFIEREELFELVFNKVVSFMHQHI